MQVYPSQISPGENFDLFYFIRNPLDNTTYYVQAVIYDVRTSAVLATVQLARSSTNTRMFAATVTSPPDPSGYGRNILAIASVYTDSGYTTKSQTYEEQEQYFLVKDQFRQPGSAGIDGRALGDLIEQKITSALKGLPKPATPEPVDLSGVTGAIGALQREINRVPKDNDDQAILEALATLKTAIEALPPPTLATDLTPMLKAVALISAQLTQLSTDIQKMGGTLIQAQRDAITTLAPQITAQLETALQDWTSKQSLSVPLTSILGQRNSPAQAPDLSHLMG